MRWLECAGGLCSELAIISYLATWSALQTTDDQSMPVEQTILFYILSFHFSRDHVQVHALYANRVASTFFFPFLWFVCATGAAVAAFAAHKTQLQSVKWFVYAVIGYICVCLWTTVGQADYWQWNAFRNDNKNQCGIVFVCAHGASWTERVHFFCFCRCYSAKVLTACHFVQSRFLRVPACYVDQLWPLLTEL